MRAVDTNVLVRLIARDDAKQVAAAESFAARGGWVSHLVLAETLWVLESVYELDAERCATTVDMLLNHRSLTLQDPEVVTAALSYAPLPKEVVTKEEDALRRITTTYGKRLLAR